MRSTSSGPCTPTGRVSSRTKLKRRAGIRLAADQGLANAQSLLGSMYALGWGVRRDLGLAYMWLNIASANGEEAARERLDNLEDDMTRAEISRATELARTCMTSDYKDCEP